MRRGGAEFGIAFLDVICCGFGAVVLLLVILARAGTVEIPDPREQAAEAHVEEEEARRRLREAESQQAVAADRLARLQSELAALRSQGGASRVVVDAIAEREGELAMARQQLSEEMKRLLGTDAKRRDDAVAGIPVDSEYVIFVIDTSGSMAEFAWPLVLEKFEEILDIYPNLKGVQVMNDMGIYMFSGYRGRWIPDTPGRRRAIINRLRSWRPFSNSSPVEGIEQAISTFYARDRRISIYVFGDEFTGRSIQEVVNQVDRFNARDRSGARRVRIHAVGFPVQFGPGSHSPVSGIRFALLMRELTYRNGGTFVALTRHR